MKKFVIIIVIALSIGTLKAQYSQYSQFNYASQRVNPGSISLSDHATAGFIYRTQGTTPDLKLNSFLFSAKYPLIKKNGGNRWSTIGVSLGDDRTGMGGILVSNELGISYALNFAVGKKQVLSIGTKINYQSRKVDIDALYTGSQFIPGIGFGSDSGEDFTEFSANFFSIGGGIVWQKEDKNEERISHIGVSLFDINRPNESLFDSQSSLPSTLVVEGGYKIYENRQIIIYPELLYTYATLTSALNIGAVTKYSLDYINPKAAGSTLEFHTKYLLNEGVILGVQYVKEGFSVGISYDVPLHNMVSHQGAFEIGAELSRLIESRYKAGKRKKKKKTRVKRTKKRKYKRKKKSNKKGTSIRTRTGREKKEPVSSDDFNTMDISEKNKSVTDHENDSTKEIKTTTTIGQIKHEALSLEPTKLIYYFEFNSSDTEQEAINYISDMVKILKKDKYIKINVVGHTDNVGTEAYNLLLSKKRAKVIVDQLIYSNISRSRITSDGKGESEPISGNSSSKNRSMNRRVEILLYY